MSPLAKLAIGLFASLLLVPALVIADPSESLVPGASAASRQAGRTTLTPPVVQPGARVAAANKARVAGTVRFQPVRRGRPVLVQRRVGRGEWQRVSVRRQNRRGVVRFVGPARSTNGRWYTYRGVARAWKDLGKVAATPESAKVWRSRFIDEFQGVELDLAKWNYRHLGAYHSGSDRSCSTNHPDAVRVGGGRLALRVQADTVRDELLGPCIGENRHGEPYEDATHWYQNGHIGTGEAPDDAGRFLYGVAAARVKFDENGGAHGSFWLQSTIKDIPDLGPAHDGAEIDVVEYFGKDLLAGAIYSLVHYRDRRGTVHKVPEGHGTSAVPKARTALKGDDDWYKSYHVFSVEWTPRAYVFRVDGIQTRKITRGVSRVPEYLVLSMLSSGWELPRMDRSTLPNATQVDWVRIWQK